MIRMSDKPNILEALEAEKTRLLEQAAALDRKMADIARIAELAAEYNLVLAPAVASNSESVQLETLSDLIEVYKTVPRSPFHKLSPASKAHYNVLFGLINKTYGKERLSSLQLQDFERWHERWADGGKVAIAHSKIGMVRNLFGFGTAILQNDECQRLFGMLSKMRVKAPKVRTERLTPVQATLIREEARLMKRPSVALAQAFQTDINLLQKDVIGEWVPVGAAGVSDITAGPLKWVRGLRWNEIDENFVLRHSGGGWQGEIEYDLRKAPAVLDELNDRFGFSIDRSPRSTLPKSGPIIVSENDGLPWDAVEFRRWWRRVANACGIDKNVRNSDSRSRAKEGAQESVEKAEARQAK
jgi:hypothetical protein